jgi:hypothetical protein
VQIPSILHALGLADDEPLTLGTFALGTRILPFLSVRPFRLSDHVGEKVVGRRVPLPCPKYGTAGLVGALLVLYG